MSRATTPQTFKVPMAFQDPERGTGKHIYVKDTNMKPSKYDDKTAPKDDDFVIEEPTPYHHANDQVQIITPIDNPPPFEGLQTITNADCQQPITHYWASDFRYLLLTACVVTLTWVIALALMYVVLVSRRTPVVDIFILGQQQVLCTEHCAITSAMTSSIVATESSSMLERTTIRSTDLTIVITSDIPDPTSSTPTIISPASKASVSTSSQTITSADTTAPAHSEATTPSMLVSTNTATMTTTLFTSLIPTRVIVSITKHFTGPGSFDGVV